MFWTNLIRFTLIQHTLLIHINSFKHMVFLWKMIASFRHLKICKHVTPLPEKYVNRICRQPMKWWYPHCSQQATRSSWEFYSHVFLFEDQRAIQMGKTKENKLKKKGWTWRRKHYCLWKMILNCQNLRSSRLCSTLNLSFSLVRQFSHSWCLLEFCSSLP